MHLDTQVKGAVDGVVELSTGEQLPTDLIIWTAGVMANPTVVRGSDLPVEERGRIRTRPDLRVGTDEEFVEGAWAAGDVLGRPRPVGWRRGRLLRPERAARGASGQAHGEEHRRGPARRRAQAVLPQEPRCRRRPRLYNGAFQSGKIALTGLLAWFAHRGYHGLAMPTWERKFRVVGDWVQNFFHGRETVSLEAVQNPRATFEEFAARPRPAQPAAEPAPAPRRQEARGRRRQVIVSETPAHRVRGLVVSGCRHPPRYGGAWHPPP